MRLHELAKELGADSKRLLEIAQELGLGIKTHSSKVPAGTEGILRAAWAEELEELAEAAEPESAQEPAEEPATAGVSVVAEDAGADADEDVGREPPTIQFQAPGAEPAEADEVAEEPAADATVEATEDVPDDTDAEADADAGTEVVDEGAEADAEEEEAEAAPQIEMDIKVDRPASDASEDEAGEGGRGDDDAAATTSKVETSGPTRRRGARIVGKIDLKPSDLPRRPSSDPAQGDPTSVTPGAPRRGGDRRRSGGGGGPGSGDAARPAARHGRGGSKPSDNSRFVFDAEETLASGAIRVGHMNMQRRPPSRRPMQRRPMVGRSRRSKRPVERPTHAVTIRPPISVRDLSEVLGVKTREILNHFPGVFDPRDKNAVLETSHCEELVLAMDREITVLPPLTQEDILYEAEQKRREDAAGEVTPRAPVVAVLGHVDHGKTSLLDKLRESRLAAKEAGGITQRTSAYSVTSKSGHSVTFLDTPGHKAFTEMRARGAQITDVALLVIAADDGVMPQTEEAIDHARAAEVPIVVAINKVDKNNAQPERVKQQLASRGVMVEGWGGEIGVVEVSAETGQGLEELVERLALETEILELDADATVDAEGYVLDSSKDPRLGIVCSAIVQEGTLRAKDAILAGTAVGRVRYMLDDTGERIKEAGPSTPVQILGFEDPPEPGSTFIVVADINAARVVAADRREEMRAAAEAPPADEQVTLENLFDAIEEQNVSEINIMLKADAAGTIEVLKSTVEQIRHPEVRYKIVRAAVGPVTEDDVVLAHASGAIIVGFGVDPDPKAKKALGSTGVQCRRYDVIYEMSEDLERALEGQLAPEFQEEVIGHATIRAIFKSSRTGNIAGCYVTDGIVTRDSHVRLLRDGDVVWNGKLGSLRRFKEDAKEVREGYECGVHLQGYNDIREEDVIEAYKVNEVKRTLASASTEG